MSLLLLLQTEDITAPAEAPVEVGGGTGSAAYGGGGKLRPKDLYRDWDDLYEPAEAVEIIGECTVTIPQPTVKARGVVIRGKIWLQLDDDKLMAAAAEM